jgi:hypothetical protein
MAKENTKGLLANARRFLREVLWGMLAGPALTHRRREDEE